MDTDDAFRHWLKTVQGSDLGDRDVLNPSRSNTPLGQLVKDAGGGRVFDAEPAGYYKLLRDSITQDDAS